MRAVAGGLAANLDDLRLVPAGRRLRLPLFIVAGKRYSELHTLGSEAGTRRSLVRYTDPTSASSGARRPASPSRRYSLWAFSNPSSGSVPWLALSIIPFVGALLRYAVDIDAGTAAEPEDIVWRDRVLQGIGVVWLRGLPWASSMSDRAAPRSSPAGAVRRRARPGPTTAGPSTSRRRPGSRAGPADWWPAGWGGRTATPRRTPVAWCSTRCRR